MDCVGLKVGHKRFGNGIVIDQYDRYIEVEFDDRISKFSYPFAFEKYLFALDTEIQSELINECISITHGQDEGTATETVFSNAIPYLTLKDGTEVLYTVSSSLKTVRVHFFNIVNRVSKTACVELPENKWIKCINYDDKELADIRLFCAIHADEIIKEATSVSLEVAYQKNQLYLEDVKKKEAAFEVDAEESVEKILDALSAIQHLADKTKYAYSIDTNVREVFHRIEMGVQAAKDAFVLEPTNRIEFFSLRGENETHNEDGIKKYLYCLELNRAYKTSTRAAFDTGINVGNITSAAKGVLKSAGGFHWEYRMKEELPENAMIDVKMEPLEDQLDLVKKDIDYYANLPYKKEYYVDDDGMLCFRINAIPDCDKRITFPARADEIINDMIRSSIQRALDSGEKIKGLSELILKKNDKPLAIRSSIWPDLFPIELKPKVIVEVVNAENTADLAAKIEEKVNCIERIGQELSNGVTDIQVLLAKNRAYIVYEGVIWLKTNPTYL